MEAACQHALQEFADTVDWEPTVADQADSLLQTVLQRLEPDERAQQARQAVVQRIESVLGSMPDFLPDHLRYDNHWGSRHASKDQCLAKVHVFGSFCSSLWHRGCDLDITITGKWRHRHGYLLDMHKMMQRDIADMLHRVLRALLAAGVAAQGGRGPSDVQAQVIMARVPLIVFVDAHAGVAVDITVSNHAGVFKSTFTRDALVDFDPCFADLYRLVKLWAETHGLNDPKSGTLNSWSLTQMVLFHLQACQPAMLPPLWQLLHDDPPQGPRPLEDDSPAAQQQGGRGGGGGLMRAGAPYQLLTVAARQRRRLQPLYAGAGRGDDGSERPLVLLSGFLVRFREVLRQWLELGNHRGERMSTWHGAWDADGRPWRHDYLVAFEDPFDSADNTARTLGTQTRSDGGGHQLLAALDAAAAAVGRLRDEGDVAALLQTLFCHGPEAVRTPGYDPIALLQQRQQRARVARLAEQHAAWQRRQRLEAEREGELRRRQQEQEQQLLEQGLWQVEEPEGPWQEEQEWALLAGEQEPAPVFF